MKKVSIYLKLIIAFVIFLILAYFIKGNELNDFMKTILGVTSFIFGIILAFSVSNRNSRLGTIREKLREQDAVLLNIYLLSKEFKQDIIENIRNKLDNLLIKQIDYKLDDFDKSQEDVEDLYLVIEKIKVKNRSQEDARKKMLDNMADLLKINKEVSYQIKNKMMGYEWISLLILGGIILFCLFYTNNNTLSGLIIAVLSTAIVLLLLVLEELDDLTWQENNWIWEPLSLLFADLRLIPYFPKDVFEEGRINLEKMKNIKKIRIATYSRPYPDMKGKKIEIIQLRS